MHGLNWNVIKLPSLVSDAETATINTAPHKHICVILLCELQYFLLDDNKKALYTISNNIVVYQDLIFCQIRSKIHDITAIYI